MLKSGFCLMLLFFSSILSAAAVLPCKHFSFLKQGLNLQDIQSCQNQLQNCPKIGNMADSNCVKKIMQQNKPCQQLSALSRVLHATPFTLSFEKHYNFILIDQYFPADGQHSYLIFTPTQCIINTKMDPRLLDSHIEKKYKNYSFILINTSKPIFKIVGSNMVIIVPLRINKTCLACKSLADIHIEYIFNDKGKFLDVKLHKSALKPALNE